MRNLFLKVAISIFISIFIMVGFPFSSAILYAEDEEPSPPISSGKVNKFTNIYWGKGEQFPVLAEVYPPEALDVYEYDKTWVLVTYDMMVKTWNDIENVSFYGYIKRSDITCDPELMGDESAEKAVTSSGKRKGKKPKTNTSSASPGATTEPKETPAASEEPKPTIPVEELEEFDWIIRTDGIQHKTVEYDMNKIRYSFSLMAQKFGGVAASSDPLFNNNVHNPYAAIGFFSMEADMQDVIENMGLATLWEGSGGVNITGKAPCTKIYLDTKSDDPSLVNFEMNLNFVSQGEFDPKAFSLDNNYKVATEGSSTSSNMPLKMQLKKSGGGYKLIIVGILPDGSNLEVPAILEKAMNDPDKYDKEAKDADDRRKAAEAEYDEYIKAKMQEKLDAQKQQEAEEAAAKAEAEAAQKEADEAAWEEHQRQRIQDKIDAQKAEEAQKEADEAAWEEHQRQRIQDKIDAQKAEEAQKEADQAAWEEHQRQRIQDKIDAQKAEEENSLASLVPQDEDEATGFPATKP